MEIEMQNLSDVRSDDIGSSIPEGPDITDFYIPDFELSPFKSLRKRISGLPAALGSRFRVPTGLSNLFSPSESSSSGSFFSRFADKFRSAPTPGVFDEASGTIISELPSSPGIVGPVLDYIRYNPVKTGLAGLAAAAAIAGISYGIYRLVKKAKREQRLADTTKRFEKATNNGANKFVTELKKDAPYVFDHLPHVFEQAKEKAYNLLMSDQSEDSIARQLQQIKQSVLVLERKMIPTPGQYGRGCRIPIRA